MLHVGFTGTRHGISHAQMRHLFTSLAEIEEECDGIVGFHHGDCVGADAEAHVMAIVLGYRVIVHPPKYANLRARCHGHEHLEPKGFMKRNYDIVRACSLLLATPCGTEEMSHRSGTWATIRYARKKERKVVIFQ